MSVSAIDEIIDTLTELKRLHALNMELLEQLEVTSTWLLSLNTPIPNAKKFYSLLTKSKALLIEIQANEPRTLRYQKLADEKKPLNNRRFLTGNSENDETDEDFKRPLLGLYK